MNLKQQTSIAELRSIFATADDHAGNHVLWVDVAGDVHLTMTEDRAKVGGDNESGRVRLRFAPFEKSDGMVGAEAALDTELIGDLHAALLHHWMLASGAAPGVIDIDLDDPDTGPGWSTTEVAVVDDALLSELQDQHVR